MTSTHKLIATLTLFSVFCRAIFAASTPEQAAENLLRQHIQSASGNKIKLLNFKKTDGRKIEALGIHGYELQYQADIEFEVHGERQPSDGLEGALLTFQVTNGAPWAYIPGVTDLDAGQGRIVVERGDIVKIAGSMEGQEWESGWKFELGSCKIVSSPVHNISASPPSPPPARTSREYEVQSLTKYYKADFAGAIIDCTKAIELEPTNDLAYIYRGHAKRSLKDYAGAMVDYNKAHALNSGGTMPYLYIAQLQADQLQFAEALASYRNIVKLANDYNTTAHFDARFHIWLIRSRLGQQSEADKELTDFLEHNQFAQQSKWLSGVVHYFTGNLAEPEFIAVAKEPNPRAKVAKESSRRRQVCAAYYFAGMKHLLGGDKSGAVGFFKQCLDTGEKQVLFYEYAQTEMTALNSASIPAAAVNQGGPTISPELQNEIFHNIGSLFSRFVTNRSQGHIRTRHFFPQIKEVVQKPKYVQYVLRFRSEIEFLSDGAWLPIVGTNNYITYRFTNTPALLPDSVVRREVHQGEHAQVSGELTTVKGESGWRFSLGEARIDWINSPSAAPVQLSEEAQTKACILNMKQIHWRPIGV